MLPSMLSQFVSTVKETSLAYVISVQELTYAANQVNSVLLTKPFEVFALLALTYFILNFGLSSLIRLVELRIGRRRAGSCQSLERCPHDPVFQVQKWYGAYQALADGRAGASRRSGCGLRPIGFGQVHADTHGQPARTDPAGTDRSGRQRYPRRRPAAGCVAQPYRLCIPAVQPVPAPVCHGQPDAGAADAQTRPPWRASAAWRCWNASAWRTRPTPIPRSCPAASSSAWRSPGAGHESAGDAVRRTDQRFGSRDGGRGVAGDERAGPRRHDHGVRDARDGFRARGGRHGLVHGRGRIVETAEPERFFTAPESDRARRFLAEIRR